MPGPDPGIPTVEHDAGTSEMAGTSPAMTTKRVAGAAVTPTYR